MFEEHATLNEENARPRALECFFILLVNRGGESPTLEYFKVKSDSSTTQRLPA